MTAAFQAPAFPPALSAPAPSAPASAIPSGTFAPGTKVQVGVHRVVIEKYLSEGGFAHVYVVRLPKPIDGEETAVLKRVAVPDKDTLATMRTEVETMKKLKGRRHIVTYIDSHASQLQGAGYEVFLLMEYCNGGGLIDFMNTRLQNRLTEPEVLKIFSDVAQGVACMHYLKPPLLHRDLKVENVLIAKSGSSRLYKLCDFGSTASPRPAAANAAEGRLIEEDVQKHTTLQYRSPEMIDVYRKQAIDEKSDIWALGVLLYKLCFYRTPFEDQGQMAILNASFKFPGYPSFSDKLKKLIASMLRERPQQRPNIYQVVREVALIRGTDIPIKDIYAGRTQSEARRNQHLPSSVPEISSPPVVGVVHSSSASEAEALPDIAPMRRGRPTKAGGDTKVPKPSPSPLRPVEGDPFSVLDSRSVPASDVEVDELSSRFPALDNFSLLHEKGSRFSFDPKSEAAKPPKQDISVRVTNALADDAFAQAAAKSAHVSSLGHDKPNSQTTAPTTSSRPVSSHNAPPRQSSRPVSMDHPLATKSTMVSTGTMTSPPPPEPTQRQQPASHRPIFRLPTSSPRSASQPRKSDADQIDPGATKGGALSRQSLLQHRSKSQILTADTTKLSRAPSDSSHRSSYLGGLDDSVHRSKSANSKSRPSSMQSSKPNILRRLSRERSDTDQRSQDTPLLTSTPTGEANDSEDAFKIDSNVEYLKAMEEGDTSKRKEKRMSGGSKHVKRSSIPSVSLSGTKQMLAGRFGEAFRKFESSNGPERRESSRSPVRGPSDLTPIAGSEATDDRSDDGHFVETEEVPPEVRRELERRRLSQEERRVADAGAAHKQRLAEGQDTKLPAVKALSIQSKVKSLLDESGRASPSPTKSVAGYGRFTDIPVLPSPNTQQASSNIPPRLSSRQRSASNSPSSRPNPQPSKYPPRTASASKPSSRPSKPSSLTQPPRLQNSATAPPNMKNLPSKPPPALDVRPSPLNSRPFGPFELNPQRPSGPPKPLTKPQALRTGDRKPASPAKPSALAPQKPPIEQPPPAANALDGPVDDDWEINFSKRYPDLSGLEMVETEIDQREGMKKVDVGEAGEGSAAGARDV